MSEDTIWIWGRHPVLEAVRAGTVRRILLAENHKPAPVLQQIQSEAAARGVQIEAVPSHRIERIAPGQNSQGVAAETRQVRLGSIEELIGLAGDSERAPFLLALDQIQDPHNIGSLLRSADAAGVQGVIVPERRSAMLGGAAAKVSAGAIGYVPIVEVTNLAQALNELQQAGIWVIGLDGEARQSMYSIDLTEPVALVVGGEESGLRRLTRQHCDLIVRLPMLGRIGSLNASVAGAIAMYEVVRQRDRL